MFNQWKRVDTMNWGKKNQKTGQKANSAKLDPSLLSLFGLVKSLGPGAEPIRKGLSVKD